MNKKGQTLILFVILIPVLLGLCAFVVDVGFMVCNRVRLREVSKNIIEVALENKEDEEDIRALYLENNFPVQNLQIDLREDSIHLQNEYEIDSIFGSIIGIEQYTIRVDLIGRIENEKIVFE